MSIITTSGHHRYNKGTGSEQQNAAFYPDTYISDQNPTTNYGTIELMGVGNEALGKATDRKIVIFTIDLTDRIPTDATVSAASMMLYITSRAGNPQNFNYRFSRLRRTDWVETEATWNIYKTSNNWSTAGGLNTTNDIDETDAVNASGPSTTGWWTVTGFANMVQDAIDSRSMKLHIHLRTTASPGIFHSFGFTATETTHIGPGRGTYVRAKVTWTLPDAGKEESSILIGG